MLFGVNTKIEEIFKQRKEDIKKQKIEDDKLKLCCSKIFSSHEGKVVLKYLKKISLFHEQDLNINSETLIYKKGRRDIWLIFRNFLPVQVLAQVEIFDDVNKTGDFYE